ncbi:MAG: type II toxin-antitoxin system HicA family toxin [Dehalococcoidales bacterium]|nr:type II toxin-antitoxin system HicA family toxin [Dehalococcoidales bacterium]
MSLAPKSLGRCGELAGILTAKKGSHVQVLHPDRPGMRVTVAVHPGETIKLATLRTIIDQAGLSVDEFIKLL